MTSKNSKPLSPLQQMTKQTIQAASLGKHDFDELDSLVSKHQNKIIEVDPNTVCNWQFADRPTNELGDLESLAEEFKTIGQLQPAILRYLKNDEKFKYEIVVGERRWRASIIAKVKLKAVILDVDDKTAAYFQVAENLSRQNLSDYAKGMSFSKLIQDNILTQKDLEEKFQLNQTALVRLLSFAQIPTSIKDAIGDFSNVSARTAAEIRAYARKGPEYINCLIALAPKLSSGKLGPTNLKNAIQVMLDKNAPFEHTKTEKILDKKGKHIISLSLNADKKVILSLPSSTKSSIDLLNIYARIREEIINYIKETEK